VTTAQLSQEGMQTVKQLLWAEPTQFVYALLDGASVSDLLDHLYAEVRPEFECLYAGELEPDMAEVAPYLVKLERDNEFTDWALGEGWRKHWGIFAVTGADLRTMRNQFRKLNTVYSADGKPMLFRYYDPRVLRTFLPGCDESRLAEFFGSVAKFAVEAEEEGKIQLFSLKGTALNTELKTLVRMAAGGAAARSA
jgi:hypothetical protein